MLNQLANLYEVLYVGCTYFRTEQDGAMITAPLTEVRDNLREIVDDVSSTGTEYVITRHGRPVAVVLGFDEYESLVETLNIMSDEGAMSAIAEAESEVDD